jgi:hypothetical protein
VLGENPTPFPFKFFWYSADLPFMAVCAILLGWPKFAMRNHMNLGAVLLTVFHIKTLVTN